MSLKINLHCKVLLGQYISVHMYSRLLKPRVYLPYHQFQYSKNLHCFRVFCVGFHLARH